MNKITKEITKQVTVRNSGELETIEVKGIFEDFINDYSSEPNYLPGMFTLYGSDRNMIFGDQFNPDYNWLIYHSTIDLCYAAMNIRASYGANCKPIVYEIKNQFDSDPITNPKNAVIRLLRKPNKTADITYYDMVYRTILMLDSLGNAWWKCNRNPFDVPDELFVLPIYDNMNMTARYDMVKTPDGRLIDDGTKRNRLTHWEYNPNGVPNDKSRIYDSRDIIHFKYQSLTNDIYGTGIIAASKDFIKIKEKIKSFQYKFFKNDATAKVYLINEKTFNADSLNEYADNFRRINKNNTTGVSFISGGWKPEKGNLTPQEADFNSTLKFNTTQILGMFGIPQTFLSITEDANRAIDKESMKQFLNTTVKKFIQIFDIRLTNFIQNNFETLFEVYHDLQLPTDELNQINKSKVAGAYGGVTYNEYRRWLALDRLKLDDGSDDPKGYELMPGSGKVSDEKPNDSGEDSTTNQPINGEE